jgi:hypothetical protein|tara:strand:- start:2110 stop:2364 length:255 start_codon:yes stop_codon:yes gene_type:complete
MTKDMMAKALSDFFAEEGVEKMDLTTYKSHGTKVPVKDYMLRRAFGSWSRVLSAMKKRHPVVVAVKAPTPTPAPAPKAKKKAEK